MWTGGQVDRWTGGQVDRWTGGQVDRCMEFVLRIEDLHWFTIKIYANHVFLGYNPKYNCVGWRLQNLFQILGRRAGNDDSMIPATRSPCMVDGKQQWHLESWHDLIGSINHPVLAHHFQLRCRWKWSEQSMGLQDLFASEEHVDEAGHWGAWRGLITADLHWKGGASKAMPIYHPYFDGVYTSHFW